ncbi:MAG TPA: hypothetical protein HA349_00180 [Methanotrichaceae archaeon]|nr:hypothetical protein [Methanotrichaceae archaeon]
MKIDLDQILSLAGDLEQEDSRKRFQSFLVESAKDDDSIREMAAQAQNRPDLQHCLALQDLVWSLGAPLGFEPSLQFGGLWKSPSGVHFLLEMVAEEQSLNLGALVGRVESLVSISAAATQDEGVGEAEVAEKGEKGVEEREVGELEDEELSALGLLVVQDSEILRVEDAIIEGDEEGQVRTISISALLSLARIVKDYHLIHEDVLLLLLTSGPSVDPIIDLISRVISQCEAETPTLEEIAQILGPLGRGSESTPEEALQDMIDQSQYYAFGNRGAGRRQMKL